MVQKSIKDYISNLRKVNGIIVTFASLMLNQIMLLDTSGNIYFDLIKQIESDWTAVPFVEIVIDPYSCPADTEPVFSNTWGGTREGCIIQSGSSNYRVETKEWYNRFHAEFGLECDEVTYTEPPVE